MWLAGNKTAAVGVEKFGAEAIATLPQFHVDPQDSNHAIVDFDIKRFRVELSGTVGAISCCFMSEKLDQQMQKMFSPIARYQGPKPLLPDCISAGGNQMNSSRPCSDGVSSGRMSAERPERNLIL